MGLGRLIDVFFIKQINNIGQDKSYRLPGQDLCTMYFKSMGVTVASSPPTLVVFHIAALQSLININVFANAAYCLCLHP